MGSQQPFLGENDRYYYTYKITSLIPEKPYYYLGKHVTKNLNDRYFGSGTKWTRILSKHGMSVFRKEILEFYENHSQLSLAEIEVISCLYETDKWCCNLKSGEHSPGYSQELRDKISNSLRGRRKSPEHIKKITDSKRQNGTDLHSEETKEKIRRTVRVSLSISLNRDKLSHPGQLNGFFQKHHTQETVNLLSKAAKSRPKIVCEVCGRIVIGTCGYIRHRCGLVPYVPKKKVARKRLFDLVCSECGETYSILATEDTITKGDYRKTCSNKCLRIRVSKSSSKLMTEERRHSLSLKNRGKEVSLEVRQKQSQSQKKRYQDSKERERQSINSSGEKNGMYGKVHSPETRQKISIANKKFKNELG